MARRVLGVAAAYACLAVVVVGWGWLLTHPLSASVDPTDDAISRWFAGHRTAWLTPASDVGTLMGETPIGLGVGVLVAVVGGLALRSAAAAALVLVADAGDGGIYFLGTHAGPRDRPPVHILDSGLVPDRSFPSGHTGTAVAVYGGAAVLLALWLRRRGIASALGRGCVVLLACVPFFVALSRLYQGAHHLTDVGTALVYGVVVLAVLSVGLGLRSGRAPAPVPRSRDGQPDAPVPHR